MKTLPRRVLKVLLVPFVLLILFAAFIIFQKFKFERQRTRWKDQTLARLSQLSVTNEEIRQELSGLKSTSSDKFDNNWAGDNVLLMTNGEYILYAFRHGFNDGFVNHLLLGHTSDGRWLYSTYHFHAPIEGAGIAPASINDFMQLYSAKQFDGKSDVCLQKTWPTNR